MRNARAILPYQITPYQVAVAIPVHNEAETIERCLNSLAAQANAPGFVVFPFLNNCTDQTATLIRSAMSALPYPVHIEECRLAPHQANAGVARRLAMQRAARALAPHGVLLTTDADTMLPPHWIAANLAAIDAGADAVAGMAVIDPVDLAALPRHLVRDEDRAMALAGLLDEIDARIDPDAADPWPRHTHHSGASIAVRADWHERVGGIPAVAAGEDRRFFAELRRIDARIRHCPDIAVTVSGRRQGRAKGGMADALARRSERADVWMDDTFETAADRVRRAGLRALLRRVRAGSALAHERQAIAAWLPNVDVSALAFGQAWHHAESLALAHAPIRWRDIDRELDLAAAIVGRLPVSEPADPVDTRWSVAVEQRSAAA